MMRTFVRRLFKLALIGGLTAVVVTWFRNREPEILDPPSPGTAQWAPLDPTPSPDMVSEPSDGAAADPAVTDGQGWVAPDDDGGCPLSHPVKAKVRSGIYHVPDGLAYGRTNADRCYASPESAEADGYRASKM